MPDRSQACSTAVPLPRRASDALRCGLPLARRDEALPLLLSEKEVSNNKKQGGWKMLRLSTSQSTSLHDLHNAEEAERQRQQGEPPARAPPPASAPPLRPRSGVSAGGLASPGSGMRGRGDGDVSGSPSGPPGLRSSTRAASARTKEKLAGHYENEDEEADEEGSLTVVPMDYSTVSRQLLLYDLYDPLVNFINAAMQVEAKNMDTILTSMREPHDGGIVNGKWVQYWLDHGGKVCFIDWLMPFSTDR